MTLGGITARTAAGHVWLPLAVHPVVEHTDQAGGRKTDLGAGIPCHGTLSRETGTLTETDARVAGVTITRYLVVRHGGLNPLLAASGGKYVLVDHESVQRRIVSTTEVPRPWGRYLLLEVEGEGRRRPGGAGYVLDYGHGGEALFLAWHGAQLIYGA